MYTNTHDIYLQSFQYGLVSYPDRYSYRTMNKRRDAWRFRLYYQFRECLDGNGMAIFDTLTYDDEHLPHVSDYCKVDIGNDFSCFNPENLKLFLDRLHSMLRYYKYPTFKHFICSEYGKDNLYCDSRGRLRKATKRPHYHIVLFFEKRCDNVKLSKMIHDCWQCGRTDNYGSYYGERSRNYVNYNTFTSDSVGSERLLKISDYLCKYVLKDVKFSRKVDTFVRHNIRSNYPLYMDEVQYKAYLSDCNSLRKRISEFILTSNGLGSYYLEPQNLDMQLIYERSMVRMPDKQRIWRYIPIPEYYLRKLFYKLVKGSWKLNDEGKKYYKYHLANRCNSLEKHYSNLVCNLDSIDSGIFQKLMDGRTIRSLAEYVCYYKGRILDLSGIDSMPTIDDVVARIIEPCGDVVENDPIPKIDYYYKPEFRYLWNIVDGNPALTSRHLVVFDVLHRDISVDTWKDKIIDDSYDGRWYDFDTILSLFHRCESCIDRNRQDVFDKRMQLEFVFS